MSRAFGSHVIAASHEVAASLMQRFGLSSVTLDGVVTRRGVLVGGWTQMQPRGSSIDAKLKADAAAQDAAALTWQLEQAQERAKYLRSVHAQKLEALAALELAAAEAAAAVTLRQAVEEELRAASADAEETGAKIRCLQAERNAKLALQQAIKEGNTACPGHLKEVLTVEADRLQALVEAAHAAVDMATKQQLAKEAVLQDIERQIATLNPEAAQSKLSSVKERLLEVEVSFQKAVDTAATSRRKEHEEKEKVRQRLQEQVTEGEKAVAAAGKEVAVAQGQCERLESVLEGMKRLRQRIDGGDFGDVSGPMQEGGTVAHGQSLNEMVQEVTKTKASCDKLLVSAISHDIFQSHASTISAAHSLLCRRNCSGTREADLQTTWSINAPLQKETGSRWQGCTTSSSC